MYSRKLHSYVISASVIIDMVLLLDWDELPAHAQVLIQAKTAYKIFNDIVGSELQSSLLGQAVAVATQGFQASEDEVESFTFLDPTKSLTAFNLLQRNGVPSTYRTLY